MSALGHATYIIAELVWSLPVLAVQWMVGARVLWRNRRVWAVGCVLPTLYLCGADSWAIHNGIWQISPARTTGIIVANLPIEEAIFFLVTNAMVVQTVVLVRGTGSQELIARLRHIITRRS